MSRYSQSKNSACHRPPNVGFHSAISVHTSLSSFNVTIYCPSSIGFSVTGIHPGCFGVTDGTLSKSHFTATSAVLNPFECCHLPKSEISGSSINCMNLSWYLCSYGFVLTVFFWQIYSTDVRGTASCHASSLSSFMVVTFPFVKISFCPSFHRFAPFNIHINFLGYGKHTPE